MPHPARPQSSIVFLLAAGVLLWLYDVASACPTCKDSLAGEGSNVAQGYFWSILFMMSMPFLIFAGLGIYFYLLVCRARAAAGAELDVTAESYDGTPVCVETPAETPHAEEPVHV